MCANVAVGNGAKDCICNGMQADVGVGMSLELVRVGNGDATDDDCISFIKGMNIIASAYSDVCQWARGGWGDHGFSHGEIFLTGKLAIGGAALDDMHRLANPFSH